MNEQNYIDIPLYVDLDGTLIKTDLLFECFIEFIKKKPFNVLLVFYWLVKGKAYLKHKLAQETSINIEDLPYNDSFLSFLTIQNNNGKKLILATAANKTLAKKIAKHLDIFSDVIASDDKNNISGVTKLTRIKEHCGDGVFDYAGDSKSDLIIFEHAKSSILVNFNNKLYFSTRDIHVVETFSSPNSLIYSLLKAIRPQQWVKNLLLFVPVFVGNQWNELNLIMRSFIGFVAFCLIASAVYIFNDLIDIQLDRAHVKKKYRPFAAGFLTAQHGLLVFFVFIVAGLSSAYLLNLIYFLILILYLLINFLYSVYLKKIVLVDILLLSLFYTLRMVSGGIITNITLSFWLVSFSMFIFFSLATSKRYAEVQLMNNSVKSKIPGRGYYNYDLTILNIMGVTSGYIAVLVIALYINSPEVISIYSSPKALWGVCLLLFFWISHIWFTTSRGKMDEDPITFAFKDRTSLVVFALLLINVILAMVI